MNCPKCHEPMEVKVKAQPMAAVVGGNCLTIYQCPTCKYIEVWDMTAASHSER